MISECRLISVSVGQPLAGLWRSVAAVVSNSDPVCSSCHVWESVTDMWFLCVSVWAGLNWAIGHMFELCVQPLSWCFLGVTCTFVLRAGEPCVLMPIATLITCSMSPAVCPSQLLMHLPKHRRERREEWERRPSSVNGKHTEHFSFICFLPVSFCFGFFYCRRFQPRATWGFSLLWLIWRLLPDHAVAQPCQKRSVTFDTNIHPIPPCHRSCGRGSQPVGRSHSALPQRFRERHCPATPLWRRARLTVMAHLGHCYDYAPSSIF